MTPPSPSVKSDQELQRALADIFKLVVPNGDRFLWFVPGSKRHLEEIQPEEWLHVLWLVEQVLNDKDFREYEERLTNMCESILPSKRNRFSISASWQQRAEALLRVKGKST